MQASSPRVGWLRERWFGAWAPAGEEAVVGAPMQLEIRAGARDIVRLARLSSCPLRACVSAPEAFEPRQLRGQLRLVGQALNYQLEDDELCLLGHRRLALRAFPPPITVMRVAFRPRRDAAWFDATLRVDVRGAGIRPHVVRALDALQRPWHSVTA